MSDHRQAPCPSDDELRQLVTGGLPDPPAGEVEAHVLDCEACQQTTMSLQLHDDTFVDQVRQSARSREMSQTMLNTEDQARVERIIAGASELRSRADAVCTHLSGSTPCGGEQVLVDLMGLVQPAECDDELGRLGGYRVLKLLGTGGMGAVFLAEDIQLRRRVALKVMRPHVATTVSSAERFLREARTAASVRHDHIVVIHQVGEDRGIPFLAMEYLEGESLEDRLRRDSGPLPISETARIGQQIADGLAAAHDHGLIHRDIKPANVWLEYTPVVPRQESLGETNGTCTGGASEANQAASTSGSDAAERKDSFRVKLLDFGLARGMEDDTRITSSGIIVGTPSYMAPEQASGEEVDQRADLFSLGCVLYRMTTGRLPFPGTKTLELLKTLATVTPVSPRVVNPDVPQPLSDLIDRLLQKDRNARPASVRHVARELSRMAALGTAVSAFDATTIEFDSKTRMRTAQGGHATKRWLIATALAAACVLLGVIVIKLRDKEGRETKITLDTPPGTKVVSVKQSDSKHPRAADSPLDALDPAKIPASERFDWQPKELVAVLGSHVWRHWGDVLSVSSNPDGSLIASAGRNDGVSLWGGSTGKQLAAWPGIDVAFSTDGQTLFIGREAEVAVVDVKSRETRKTIRTTSGRTFISVSDDAGILATWSGGGLQVFDVATGKTLLDLPFDKGFTKDLRTIALSPNGKMLAAACVEGLKLWDVVTGQNISSPDIKDVHAVTFSPDSTQLATHAETPTSGIRIWNLQTLDVVATFVARHPHHTSNRLVFSRDGKTLASCGRHTTECWDVATQIAKPPIFAGWETQGIAFTADGQTLITGGHAAVVEIWKVATGQRMNAISGNLTQASLIALTPNDRWLAVSGLHGFGGSRVYLWNVLIGHMQTSWIADEEVHGLDIDLKGTTLATAGYRGVRLWDLPTGNQQPPLQDNPAATDVKFAPDGTTLSAIVLIPEGNEIRSWQLSTGQRMSSFRVGPRNGYARWLDQTRDGSLFAYGDSVWDAATHTMRFSEVQQYGFGRWNPVFSTDGKRLLVIRAGDNHIVPTTYDTTTGELLESFRGGHQGEPSSAIFLRDDKTIVSAGHDGQLIEWRSPRERRVLCKLPGPVLNLSLAADGRHLFTANSNGTVYVLRLTAPDQPNSIK